MVTNCEYCGSDDLTVIRCEKCHSERFIKQKISWTDDRTGRDTATYDNESHLLEKRYEYVCYDCGNKLVTLGFINVKGTKNNGQQAG